MVVSQQPQQKESNYIMGQSNYCHIEDTECPSPTIIKKFQESIFLVLSVIMPLPHRLLDMAHYRLHEK